MTRSPAGPTRTRWRKTIEDTTSYRSRRGASRARSGDKSHRAGELPGVFSSALVCRLATTLECPFLGSGASGLGCERDPQIHQRKAMLLVGVSVLQHLSARAAFSGDGVLSARCRARYCTETFLEQVGGCVPDLNSNNRAAPPPCTRSAVHCGAGRGGIRTARALRCNRADHANAIGEQRHGCSRGHAPFGVALRWFNHGRRPTAPPTENWPRPLAIRG